MDTSAALDVGKSNKDEDKMSKYLVAASAIAFVAFAFGTMDAYANSWAEDCKRIAMDENGDEICWLKDDARVDGVEPLTETAFEESQGGDGGSDAGGDADGEVGDRAAASTAAE